MARIASSSSDLMEAKDWVWETKRRIVVLCCLKRRVHCCWSGAFEGWRSELLALQDGFGFFGSTHHGEIAQKVEAD